MNRAELTLELLKQRLLAEEMKRTDRCDPIQNKRAAFMGGRNKKVDKLTGKCLHCGKVGHMQKNCRLKKHQGESNLACEVKAVFFIVKAVTLELPSKP